MLNYIKSIFIKTIVVEKVVKDPHGLIRTDLIKLERIIDSKPYKVGDSIESVAYRQGQQDFLAAIKTHIIGER